jgi:hypothetical protein
VALIERDDNDYLIVGARYLDSDEVASVTKMLGGLQGPVERAFARRQRTR